MKQERKSNHTQNNISEQAPVMQEDKHYLYNLLFAGRITLKEYLKEIKPKKQ